ncbi:MULTISPECIES: hypothetical protein [Streptococcus]|uniref:ABC transporter permease n=1 Tax=Streptococcus caledonicus TaxID=2614158 RepID=A0ABW0UBV8_9STRE|nr:hypothetical protein [Streptococcus sp. S784/96/1]
MLKFLKADCYRIFKERLSLISLILLLLLSGGIAYIIALQNMSTIGVATFMMPFFTSFFPLFFVTPGKIFFGEDFVQRTINNSLIKVQSRSKTFAYRWLMSMVVSFFYIFIAYIFAGFVYQLSTGDSIYARLFEGLLYQIPYYLATAALPLVFFNLFDKLYKTNTLFIITFTMFETFAKLILGMLLKIDSEVYQPYMLFGNLANTVDSSAGFINHSSIVAFVYAIIFTGISYFLFARREFK